MTSEICSLSDTTDRRERKKESEIERERVSEDGRVGEGRALSEHFIISKFQLKSGLKYLSVTQPIALYGSEVWGPLSHQSLSVGTNIQQNVSMQSSADTF